MPRPAATSGGRSSSTSTRRRRRRRCRCPTTLLRAYLGGAGLGAWLMHRAGAARRRPAGPEAPLAFVFSPLVGTPLTTSAKFAVVAKSPLTGLLNDALASSHFAIAGKLTGHDAIVVRGRARSAVRRCSSTATASRLEPRRDLLGPAGRRRRGARCASGSAAAGGSPRSARRASAASATPRSRTTAGTPAAAGSARCWARRTSRRSPSAAATKVAPADPDAVLARGAGPAGAVVRPGHREVPRARHAGQPARVQRDQHAAHPQLPGRDVRRGAAARRRGPGRSCARSRANSCASCTIGCEHIYAGQGRQARRGWSTRTSSRSARCAGCPTRTPCSRPARAATSSGSTRSRPAARSPGRWSAPSAA